MEEKKLLRALIIIITCFIAISSMAEETDLAWAEELASKNQLGSLESLKEMMNLPGFDQNIRDEVLKPRPALQIFVSSSMPKALLKQYAVEARRYGGVLVLRGLPGGSFHKLTDIAIEISNENTASMQIDDEAFRAFEVTSVPTIILSKVATIFSGKTAAEKFDKVAGNIRVKAALELFESNGDMAEDAKELLR